MERRPSPVFSEINLQDMYMMFLFSHAMFLLPHHMITSRSADTRTVVIKDDSHLQLVAINYTVKYQSRRIALHEDAARCCGKK